VEESPGFTADGAMNMSKKKLNFQEAATLTREIIGIEDGFQKFYPFLKVSLFLSLSLSGFKALFHYNKFIRTLVIFLSLFA